ncbi:R2-like ligand-binding oxidase [Alicyclobacillus curvatus]|nr:R2-like ligand-binding oxidase [Alicyclobacillus curvatus]
MREMQTVTEKGLNHSILPMRLYHKAKKMGIWDPMDIDFTKDREDWRAFNEVQQGIVLGLISVFQAGEEAVTRDILPLIRVISLEGRLEEEMYLTTFLFEEAKHTEVFRRFLDEVVVDAGDLTEHHGPSYQTIFHHYLPNAMERLITDASPIAQAEASVTYNMVVEGILAETGYHVFYDILEKNQKLPGLLAAIGYLKRDESRHIGYGTYLLSRLISANNELWEVVNQRIQMLLPYAMGVVTELFQHLETRLTEQQVENPWHLDQQAYANFAMTQFQYRMSVLERAKWKSVDDIYRESEAAIGIVD